MPQQLRYEGSQLDDVLERVRDEHGPGARIVSADLARTKGIGGFFARETYQVTVELDPPPHVVAAPRPAAAAPAAAPVPAVAPVPPAAYVPDADTEPPPPDFRHAVRPSPDFARLLADMVDDPADGVTPSADVSARPVDITGDELDRPRVVTMSESLDQSPVALCELVGELGHLMLPTVPIPARGVVAIVGARSDAVEVAVAMAQNAGRAASDVMVAAPTDSGVTPRTVAAIVAESGRRRTQRGLTGPVIVAVAIAPGTEGERWATDTVAALDASQVRVAVGGWRPIERTMQHLAALRSVVTVDALDLVELDGASAPEQFLRLGLPVATIDGVEATATMWAALLLDCGRAAALMEGELAPAAAANTAPARGPRLADVDFRDPEPRPERLVTPPPVPADVRGPVPAVFPRVSVPVRR